MRRSSRWALGTAALAGPILASALPAAAATASDQDSSSVSFTTSGDLTANCLIAVAHDVDSTSGEIAAELSTNGGVCRGTLIIELQYVDDHGDPAQVETSSAESVHHILVVRDAGRTAVTVDYSVEFDDCSSNCSHSLQTKTK